MVAAAASVAAAKADKGRHDVISVERVMTKDACERLCMLLGFVPVHSPNWFTGFHHDDVMQ